VNGRAWSVEDMQTLEANYRSMTTRELAELLGRSRKCVLKKAHFMGLRKPVGYTPATREAYELRDDVAMTFAEIATTLGCSTITVNNVFRAATKKLRAALFVRGYAEKDIQFLIGE